MGEARHQIDDQQHVLATIAEKFGDGQGGLGRQPAHHRAFVAGRNDRDREPAILAERIVEEFAYLAAALANQRDDDGGEALGAGKHAQQRRFADTGACEDANALTGAERHEKINSAHAGPQRCFHARAVQRQGRRRFD